MVRRSMIAVAGVVGMIAVPALAQWEVVRLNHWASLSRAKGVGAGGIVGVVRTIESSAAKGCLWYYDSEDSSWHERYLDPLDPPGSAPTAIADDQIVGNVRLHAALWSDSTSSWVDLHPADAIDSFAFGVGDGVQVGSAYFGRFFAGYWRGSASTWVNLSPSLHWSMALAGNAAVQVGWTVVYTDSADHAALWRGKPESFVDLHPAELSHSYALGVSGDEQVGYATIGSSNGWKRAGLWRGTAASWVSLHPDASIESSAQGVFNGIQVGYATISSTARKHAALWRGSAATFEDLHFLLGPCFVESAANAVWQDESYTYVVGNARDSGRADDEAILWLLPATPFCPADLNLDGFVNGDDFDYFAEYFESGHPLADFNNDCFVNGNDYDRFAEAFEAGC